MTDLKTRYEQQRKFSWPRVAANSAAIAVHVLIFMMLMAPVAGPDSKKGDDEITLVSFAEPPPPPPPDPPKELKKQIIQTTPQKNQPPPPDPPITYDTPGPVDIPAPPPSPPAPPAGPADSFGGDVDASSRSRAPLTYPPAALRAGISGTAVALITFDASGNVVDASIEKSSRNRDLDRSCLSTVKKWKVNPSIKNGKPVGGSSRIPCEFKL